MNKIRSTLAWFLALCLFFGVSSLASAGGYSAEGSSGTAFIGLGNRLYVVDPTGAVSDMPLYAPAIRSIVYMSDTDVYFLAEDDEFLGDESGAQAYQLMSVPLAGGEPKVLLRRIYGELVYIEGDSMFYYQSFDAPGMLYRFSPVDDKEGEPVELPFDEAELHATMDGLAVTDLSTGQGALFVQSVNQFFEADTYASGAYANFGIFETVMRSDNLHIRIKGSNLWEKVDDGALSQAQIRGELYYVIRNVNTGSLLMRAYTPATKTRRNVVELKGAFDPALTTAEDKIYVVSSASKVVVFDPETKAYGDFLDLSELGIGAPMLVSTGSYLIVYDAMPDEEDFEAEPRFIKIVDLKGNDLMQAEAPKAEEETLVLRTGDRNEEVRKMQARLIELNYLSDSADGVFGRKTYDAVRRLQDMLGKRQTGVANQALLDALYADDAPEYVRFRTLRRGDVGIRVEELQARAKQLDYYTGAVDGIFGSKTDRAIRLFEGDNGHDEDGIASPGLQRELFSSSASSYKRYVELRKGDTGERVKILQRKLKELGYFNGNIGGNYLNQTASAVMAFQKQMGLDTSGNGNVATVSLQKILFSDEAMPYATPKPSPKPTATPVPTPEPPKPTRPVRPTQAPTQPPTQAPTQAPTETPTQAPTQTPQPDPTQTPQPEPTQTPQPEPTQTPQPEPTQTPQPEPTQTPQPEPTQTPQPEPTPDPEPTPKPPEPPEPGEFPITPSSDESEEVIRYIQMRLAAYNLLDNDDISGLFDEKTSAAVVRFKTNVMQLPEERINDAVDEETYEWLAREP